MDLFMSDEVGDATRCPHCRGRLKSEYQMYMIAVKGRGEDEFLTIGCDAGAFCRRCPAVVIDSFAIAGHLSGHAEGGVLTYAVLGMVDLEAVPEERGDLPLGDDDNPIPLIEFRRPDAQLAAPSSRAALPPRAAFQKRRRKAKRRKKMAKASQRKNR